MIEDSREASNLWITGLSEEQMRAAEGEIIRRHNWGTEEIIKDIIKENLSERETKNDKQSEPIN